MIENTDKDNTFSAETKHLDTASAFLADKISLNLIDRGFSHIWLSGQTPDTFSGKVQLVFAGTQWISGQKKSTLKANPRFVTSISFGDSDQDPVKKVRLSNKENSASSLPFKMALNIAEQFSHRIVFIVAK
tara:strand:- start:2313 stop:2705 length:393 start_codon:yes stop_codon:yes gene_type:complete